MASIIVTRNKIRVTLTVTVEDDVIYTTDEDGKKEEITSYDNRYTPSVITYLQSKGISSKVCIFFIVDALMSDTYSITLKEILSAWFSYYERVAKIAKRAELIRASRVEKALYFALNTFYLSVFGDRKVPGCPYGDPGNNFIISITRTRSCYCLCSASFVVAMAEMFGYGHEVVFNQSPGHVNIAVIDLTINTRLKLPGSVIDAGGYFDVIEVHPNPHPITLYGVHSYIDGGITNQDILQVSSVMHEEKLKRTFLYRKLDPDLVVYIHHLDTNDLDYIHGGDVSMLDLLSIRMSSRRSKKLKRYKNALSAVHRLFGIPDSITRMFLEARRLAVKIESTGSELLVLRISVLITSICDSLYVLYPNASPDSMKQIVASTIFSTNRT